jgi:hypothetical protein
MKTFKEYVKAIINEGKSFDPISGRKLMSAWIMAQEEKSKSTASFLKNGVKISNQTFRYYSTPVEFIQGLVTNSKFKEEELTDIVKKINRQKPDKLSEYAEKILSSMNENVNETSSNISSYTKSPLKVIVKGVDFDLSFKKGKMGFDAILSNQHGKKVISKLNKDQDIDAFVARMKEVYKIDIKKK